MRTTSVAPAALALAVACGTAGGGRIYLPPVFPNPATPPTRALTAEEAEDVLRGDWLFQAMALPLLPRTAEEIGWARQLANRLAPGQGRPDLTGELAELDGLARQLAALKARPRKAGSGSASPSWIWFPEGAPAKDAPAASRYFRRTLDLPAGRSVRAATLRIATDDACEVYVNGAPAGIHKTWNRAAAFSVGKLLRPGRNVLAVHAQNMPAPHANPAGLICRLTVALADGSRVGLVSDGAWRVSTTAGVGWTAPGYNDAAWKPARIAAAYGGGPWKRIGGLRAGSSAADAYADADPRAVALYLAVRRVKRRIMMNNPVLDFSRLLLIDQPIPRGGEAIHQAIHRMGHRAVPGGRLLVLDGLHPGGQVRRLAPDKPGSFWRPDLSFDAKRVLYCYKAHDEKSFHLYEMDLATGRTKQLTRGDYDDIDPIYLPDGHILFTTTRGNSYVRCGPFIYSYTLARCDADGRNVYLISYNGEPDFVPSLLADGSVIYSRWEYTDKALWRVQSLWTVRPDGTNVAAFWGNQSIWPDHVAQPRQIPGSRRVMFCGVGHHDWWSGCVGILDPDKGTNFPHGLTKVTRDLPWPECGNGPVDPGESADHHAAGRFTGYCAPYPLSEEDFLVSARGEGGRFRLYLMDTRGNRELIYAGVHNVLHAMPLRPRRKPPALPDRVAWPGTGRDRRPPAPGTFYSPNIYDGAAGLPRGAVRHLRVFQQDHKTYSTWQKTYRHSGPAVSIIQEDSVKRILGTVPVAADGSVCFQAPPGQSLYFQLLDKDYRCLQTMRSFTGLMPGEQRGCVGCHELHSTTPPRSKGLAMRAGPSNLTPPPWGSRSIAYERFAQPVLDKHCGRCHQGKGKARPTLDLTLRGGQGPFKEPYLTLVGPAAWGGPRPEKPGPGYGIAGAIPVEQLGTNSPRSVRTLGPLEFLSGRSKLIDIASSGKHHKVKVPPADLRRLIAWVDACCPYRGDEEIRALPDPAFAGIEQLPIRPRVRTAPRVQRP